jgi:hypothetical protein
MDNAMPHLSPLSTMVEERVALLVPVIATTSRFKDDNRNQYPDVSVMTPVTPHVCAAEQSTETTPTGSDRLRAPLTRATIECMVPSEAFPEPTDIVVSVDDIGQGWVQRAHHDPVGPVECHSHAIGIAQSIARQCRGRVWLARDGGVELLANVASR